MSSWKSKPRGPIELGDEDVCFDDYMTTLQRPVPRSRSQLSSHQTSWATDSSHQGVTIRDDTNLDHRSTGAYLPHPATSTQLQLEQLVCQHQGLIDQLLIELALERGERIALEDRVAVLESKLQHPPMPQQEQHQHVPTARPSQFQRKYTGNIDEIDGRPNTVQVASAYSRPADRAVDPGFKQQPQDARGGVASPPRRGWGSITKEVPAS